MSFQSLLSSIVREGDLTLRLPGGGEIRLGDGSGPPLIAVADAVAVGEGELDGDCDTGSSSAARSSASSVFDVPVRATSVVVDK